MVIFSPWVFGFGFEHLVGVAAGSFIRTSPFNPQTYPLKNGCHWGCQKCHQKTVSEVCVSEAWDRRIEAQLVEAWPGQVWKPPVAPAPRSGTACACWPSPGALWEDCRGSISRAVEALSSQPLATCDPGGGLVGRALGGSHLWLTLGGASCICLTFI